MMKQVLVIIAWILSLCIAASAQDPANYPPVDQSVVIDSTNLPIVWIDVNGVTIQRHERIGAHMKIIHNGEGKMNYGDTLAHPGQHIDYEGYISLRYRGNSSYSLSNKKPYSFRTLARPLEQGEKKEKVSLLGMGKDNNWVLLAPYSDKSMIRDLLAFEVARPWMEYTPTGRFCELYLDGIYYGVFILTEPVTQGINRLNLDDPGEEGDELTGGYIMEVGDHDFDSANYVSKYHPVRGDGAVVYTDCFIQFKNKFPDRDDITPQQQEYICRAIDRMEDVFASSGYRDPDTGYCKYIDVQSFMDYQLVNELGHNVDAYRLGAKFYKRRDSQDPRFKMAIWDMNLAFGNCRHNLGSSTSSWVSRCNSILYKAGDPHMVPFWWYKLISDRDYVQRRFDRWAQWRESNLRDDRLMATIDSLTNQVTCCGAEARNTQAWPTWGTFVWPNSYISKDYQDEIDHLKAWIVKRIEWMDNILNYTPPEPHPSYQRGDVNCDDEVNIADVTELVNILLSGEVDPEVFPLADVNDDNEVNIADVSALINLLLTGSI